MMQHTWIRSAFTKLGYIIPGLAVHFWYMRLASHCPGMNTCRSDKIHRTHLNILLDIVSFVKTVHLISDGPWTDKANATSTDTALLQAIVPQGTS